LQPTLSQMSFIFDPNKYTFENKRLDRKRYM
jgi:hypothetical protein